MNQPEKKRVHRLGKRARTRFALAGLLLWTALPIALVVLLSIQSATATVYPRSNVLVSPVPGAGEIRRPVSIEMRWAAGTDLLAPGWQGIVTDVPVGVGAEVVNGTPLVTIDGISRVAAATKQPFFRVLQAGVTGSDVSDLNAFLRSRSFATPDSGDFTRQTLTAVRSFAGSIGVPDAAHVTSFDPAWVVFLPASGIVAKSQVVLGAPAVAPGEAVFSLAPTLDKAALVSAGTTTSAAGSTKDVNSSPLVPTERAAPGESLMVGDVKLELDKDGQYLGAGSLPILAKEVPPSTRRVSAVLALSLHHGQWLVPAAAVILDANGVACVHVASGNSQRSVSVSPMTTYDGRTAITGSISASTKVIIYPPDVSVSCK